MKTASCNGRHTVREIPEPGLVQRCIRCGVLVGFACARNPVPPVIEIRCPNGATVSAQADAIDWPALLDSLYGDPLEGATCGLCGQTADNFHVSDELWERVDLGSAQACFKCFRIAAWHAGVTNDGNPWEVSQPHTPP